MNRRTVLFPLLVLFASAAQAAAPPSNVLLPGFIQPAAGGICGVDRPASAFLTAGGRTVISFDGIYYAPTGSVGPTAYLLGGAASLTFAAGNPTRGRIRFDADTSYPSEVRIPAFKRYSASYDATTHNVRVSFQIEFPSCTLPISATYRN